MQHHIEASRRGRVPRDEFIRNRARKAPAAAVAIEPEQVVTIGVGLADPTICGSRRRRAKAHPYRLSSTKFFALLGSVSPRLRSGGSRIATTL
jgi:hypothetical protein